MADSFSKCHPVVNFIFFIGALLSCVLISHPAFLLVGVLCAFFYLLILSGKSAFKTLLFFLPFSIILTVINPLFNRRGEHILFEIFGKPYTLEALFYGGAVGGMLLCTVLWFACYNKVMTGDKFTALFGNIIPSISLLLVMVFRLVPEFVKKITQIKNARLSIGKAGGKTLKEKVVGGTNIISALTSWALEGSIVMADSMKSRGYGLKKRTGFVIYKMSLRDWLLLLVEIFLLAVILFLALKGNLKAEFLPKLSITPVNLSLLVYGLYLLLPVILQGEEALKWQISKSKI